MVDNRKLNVPSPAIAGLTLNEYVVFALTAPSEPRTAPVAAGAFAHVTAPSDQLLLAAARRSPPFVDPSELDEPTVRLNVAVDTEHAPSRP